MSVKPGPPHRLSQLLKQLPKSFADQGPITFDLGRELFIRIKQKAIRSSSAPKGENSEIDFADGDNSVATGAYQVRRLELLSSTLVGTNCQFAIDHRFILPALDQGHRQFIFRGPNYPLHCATGELVFVSVVCPERMIIPSELRTIDQRDVA